MFRPKIKRGAEIRRAEKEEQRRLPPTGIVRPDSGSSARNVSHIQCAAVPLCVHVSFSFSNQNLFRPYLLLLFLWTDAIIFGNLRTHTSVKKKRCFLRRSLSLFGGDRARNERTHFGVAGSTKMRKRVRDSGGDAGDFFPSFSSGEVPFWETGAGGGGGGGGWKG